MTVNWEYGRRPLINTLNLADLLPTSAIWTGNAEAPCPMYPPLAPALLHGVTQGSTPFRLNLHVRDLGHPAFRAQIREWLKVLRKANCLVLMATQSLSDAAASGILDVVVESTATKIFLPNVYARNEDTAQTTEQQIRPNPLGIYVRDFAWSRRL